MTVQLRPALEGSVGLLAACSRRLAGLHSSCWAGSAAEQRAGDSDAQASIFDRAAKRAQRDRAAGLHNLDDPLQAAVTENLLDRLADCRRVFSTVAVVGGACSSVVKQLAAAENGGSQVLVLDESSAMLEHTRRLEQLQASENIGQDRPEVHYIEADPEHLPLKDKSVDAVIACLSLHWTNDVPGVMTQMRRALRPDGLFLAAMWGGDTLHELRVALSLAEQEREGGVSQRVSPLAQVRDAGNLLTRAGFSIPSVDTDDITVHYKDPMQLVHHLRVMGESNAVRIRQPRLKTATWQAAVQKYREMFGKEEDGTVPATFQAIFMTGWAPAPKQAQAAPRGSASVSLEELDRAMQEEQAQKVEPAAPQQ